MIEIHDIHAHRVWQSEGGSQIYSNRGATFLFYDDRGEIIFQSPPRFYSFLAPVGAVSVKVIPEGEALP